MIHSFLLDGDFGRGTLDDLGGVKERLRGRQSRLASIPLDAVIGLLTELGRNVAQRPSVASDGAAYLALWLRRGPLERICRLNYLASHYHGAFAPTDCGFELRAQPRGVVCHWIAGNTPTLAFFSLALCLLSRNASAMKLSQDSAEVLLDLLHRLDGLETQHGGETYSGRDLVRSVALLAFDSEDRRTSEEFSRLADAKIIWGGSEAVRGVTALPQADHCETLTFGPKYSFAVLDREFVASDRLDANLEALARDCVLFNQQACSSPHVLFVERGGLELEEVADRLRRAFDTLPARFCSWPLGPSMAARVINARARHLLDPESDVRLGADLTWTVLIRHDPGLEDPVRGRTLFLKEVETIEDTVEWVTRRIQAVGVGIADARRRRSFADAVSARGVDRVVALGRMHDFDLPWDGVMALNRLVRWVVLKPDRSGSCD